MFAHIFKLIAKYFSYEESMVHNPMAAREEEAINLLLSSMKAAAVDLSDSQSLTSYINLNTNGDSKPIQFEKVLQTQYEVIERLSGHNLCLSWSRCALFTNVAKNFNECHGFLRDCVDTYSCLSCTCTCDQKNDPRTVRKVYSGLVSATGANR